VRSRAIGGEECGDEVLLVKLHLPKLAADD